MFLVLCAHKCRCLVLPDCHISVLGLSYSIVDTIISCTAVVDKLTATSNKLILKAGKS